MAFGDKKMTRRTQRLELRRPSELGVLILSLDYGTEYSPDTFERFAQQQRRGYSPPVRCRHGKEIAKEES